MFDFDATLPLMAIQFLVLMAVLNQIFFKPLNQVLDERSDYIRSNESQARERLAKTEQLATEYEQKLADARKTAQSIIATAQTEAKATADQQIADAQRAAQAKREQAQQEIEQQKQAAFQTLEQQVDELGRQILVKLLGPELVK